jgi:protein-tyrosine phosphatase
MTLRLLMVCLGNICRSPTAEAVLRHKLDAAGLGGQVEIDSAGTGDWHVGAPPDERSQRHAARRGYDLSALRARCVEPLDFERFDLILAMDAANLGDLQALRPAGARGEVRLFANAPVPDPYAGGAAGFDDVLDRVETAAEAWVGEIARRLQIVGTP